MTDIPMKHTPAGTFVDWERYPDTKTAEAAKTAAKPTGGWGKPSHPPLPLLPVLEKPLPPAYDKQAPRITPPSYAAQRIQELAARGWNKKGIAAALGVSVTTFNKWLDADENLRWAFDVGREEEHNALYGALYEAATKKGNAAAAMFLLKARHGYREGDDRQLANRVQITFNLPGAEKLEAVVKNASKKKMIDHE